MTTISLGATAINYELTGTGPDWLVLLHEIGGSLETWSAVAPAFDARFRVLKYDARGAGHSACIAGPFAIDTLVDDIGRLTAALGHAGACHIAGVAIGAAVAVRYAARHPAAVKSLVLACPAPSVSADRVRYLSERAALVEREGMVAVAETTLGNSYPPQAIGDRAVYDAYRARFLANDPASYAAVNRAFAAFDATPDLAAIACPTLVLAGRHDRLRPPDFVRSVAACIPGARYAEIDSGHIMPVQAPQAMIVAMQGFYAAVV